MLYSTACKYEGEVKELKDRCFKLMGDEDIFMEMNSDALELMQKSMTLLDTSTTLVVEQAKAIDKLQDMVKELLELAKK